MEASLAVDKSGRVWLVESVEPLHPEEQTIAEMLTGWRNQQLCRNLRLDMIDQREKLVNRFLVYTNEFPWTWTPSMVEEFFGDLRAVHHAKHSTMRAYQNALRMFCSYVRADTASIVNQNKLFRQSIEEPTRSLCAAA